MLTISQILYNITAKGLKIFKELPLLDYLQLLISIMVNTFVVEMNLSSLIPHKIGLAHQYPGRKHGLHLPQRVLYKEITSQVTLSAYILGLLTTEEYVSNAKTCPCSFAVSVKLAYVSTRMVRITVLQFITTAR